jgi:hypothetical protein
VCEKFLKKCLTFLFYFAIRVFRDAYNGVGMLPREVSLMDFGYLRGRYVAGGIELCLEPKRGGVKAKLSLKDALGKKKFSHAVSYSSKDSC